MSKPITAFLDDGQTVFRATLRPSLLVDLSSGPVGGQGPWLPVAQVPWNARFDYTGDGISGNAKISLNIGLRHMIRAQNLDYPL